MSRDGVASVPPVKVVFERHVRPGAEAAFHAWPERFVAARVARTAHRYADGVSSPPHPHRERTHMPERRDPHRGQPVFHYGARIADARIVAILLHGRGGSAQDMFDLAAQFATSDVAYIAPEAAGQTWYPHSFLSPLTRNQPHLDSALRRVEGLLYELESQGASRDRVVLMGFSQGACLALEATARHAGRYAGIVGLSGGLIGPPGTPRDYAGVFGGTPVFLGCSDIDPHIHVARVRESAETFRQMGATVDERIYEGMGHTVNRDELEAAIKLLSGATNSSRDPHHRRRPEA